MKARLGQFYTVNYNYILEGLEIPDKIKIIEPFAGQGDLLQFVNNHEVEAYDIEPKNAIVKYRDTLKTPPNYKNKWVLTNPPYLSRNKSKYILDFDLYDTNDLYKCFIIQILNDHVLGGTIIIPLNFWTSIRKSDIHLRGRFLRIYIVKLVKVFEEDVFPDTSYTVCAFSFFIRNDDNNFSTTFKFLPDNVNINSSLTDNNNYMLGGEIYKLKSTTKICRITNSNMDKINSNVVIKCIDPVINAFISDIPEKYIDNTPNASNRTYALIHLEHKITNEKILVEKINSILEQMRNKTKSLIFTNYRESKNGKCRKRISFDLFYVIIDICIKNLEGENIPEYKSFLEQYDIRLD